MKLSATHIVFIVQSILLLILFFIIIFRKEPEPYVNYNKIRMNMQETINVLKYEFDQLQNENLVLYNKIDSIKFMIPDTRKNLDEISKEINKLQNAYTTTNYSDSSDISLIRRLSK
jgi:peptidoglycan hydrolase CwlO-like protein